MRRFASLLLALFLALSAAAWAPSVSADVLPEVNGGDKQSDTVRDSSIDPADDAAAALTDGDSALVESISVDPSSVDAAEVSSGGVGAWLKNHGLGFLKGLGAGAAGALAVGAGALLLGAAASVVAGVAGLALLGGAVYGAITGSADFNWAEAIATSVVSGISSGVGAVVSSVARPLLAKAAVAATDILGGGVTTMVGYFSTTPDPTLVGALESFATGAGFSAAFLGVGAAAGKAWKAAKGALGRAGVGKSSTASAVVDGSLTSDVGSSTAAVSPGGGKSPAPEVVGQAEHPVATGAAVAISPEVRKLAPDWIWNNSVSGEAAQELRLEVDPSRLNYSRNFLTDAQNFNPGYVVFQGPVEEDIVLVQYHANIPLETKDGKPKRSLKWWTTVDQAKQIATADDACERLALLPEWGPREVMSVARIPKGTQVTFMIGEAAPQKSWDGVTFQGGGVQMRFLDFDKSWILEDPQPIQRFQGTAETGPVK